MKNIKLIVCDIDNTLVVKHQPLTDYTKQMIDECHKRGILFGLASGRGCRHLQQMADNWNIHVDLLIGMNGSEMYDGLIDKEENFYELEPDWVRQCFEIMRPFKSEPHAVRRGITYIREMSEIQRAANQYVKKERQDYIVQDEAEFWDGPSIKVGFRVSADDMPAIEERVQASKMEGFTGFKTEMTMFEFCHAEATKGKLLTEFCKRHNIKKEEVASFGDMTNDISLLQDSGFAICMCNGSDDCKAVATHITEYSVYEDGVGHFIHDHIL